MSANKIDVLAAMDAAECRCGSELAQAMREARAAVAELIEANVELAESNADPAHTLGRDLRVINAEKRLHAALARVGGAA